MSRVRVTFFIEADDPDHEMGVSETTYESVTECIVNQLGGEDVGFEKEDDE